MRYNIFVVSIIQLFNSYINNVMMLDPLFIKKTLLFIKKYT